MPDACWPPADELTEAAERIRATRGGWPRPAVGTRSCLAPAEQPGAA
ncbi:thiamine phosphate synthase, partial [Burkholderia pseudomallei]